jgi:hypothetical protein
MRNGTLGSQRSSPGGEQDVAADMNTDPDSGSVSTSSDFTTYSCPSEGSEVEVNGGVALTEEAVETYTPDILDISLRQREALGLERLPDTIMAQV